MGNFDVTKGIWYKSALDVMYRVIVIRWSDVTTHRCH